jgi:endonuclease G
MHPSTLMSRYLVVVVALCLSATVALAAPCAPHFLGGDAPALVNEKLVAESREMCFDGFAILHSGITRTPLWSAEHLTRERVEAAQGVERSNRFHAEKSLPHEERSELSDYARSGYDRGHMSPSGDMPDKRSQYESFSLANMIPQDPNNNRMLWAEIESAVRDLARDDGDLYVVTGPIFQGETLQRLHGRVLVPTGIFKAIYDAKRGEAAAYVVPNAPGSNWETVSLAELQAMTGIDVFPDRPQSVKDTAMPLPSPKQNRHRG